MADLYIKTFADVRREMETAYDEYLKTGEEEALWQSAHQVLSNSLFLLNRDEEEDIFTYRFPDDILSNKTGAIFRLLNTHSGLVNRVSTIPCEGIVWFTTTDGQEYSDEAQEFEIWEIYNVANALYRMTEPLAETLYK